MKVVVVGGGITGLSAAFELAQGSGDGSPVEVTVVEAGPRFGGKIRTRPFAGRPTDDAADAFLARVPDATDLCRQLGLEDHLVTPATRQAYLYSRGRLRPFPGGVVLGVPTDLDLLAASDAVSPAGVARAAEDLTMAPELDPPAGGDESVGSLVRRRVGDEVFERLVAPLLSGVHAGNADRLSVAAGAPQFAAAMASDGSLIAGLRHQLAHAQAGPSAPVFFGLDHGTGTLVEALVGALGRAGVDLRRSTTVVSVQPAPGTGPALVVRTATGSPGGATDLVADAVVVTTPLPATAELLAPLDRELAVELGAVTYASVAMVTLAVPVEAVDRPLDGSGFLVAQPEGLLVTACSWASSKWAHLSDPSVAILRASVGRADDERGLALDDDQLVAAVRADLGTTMELRGEPTEVRVSRWPQALPQFAVGHLDRARRWQERVTTEAPGLFVTGAGFAGLGIPACIRQGRQAAREALGATTGARP